MGAIDELYEEQFSEREMRREVYSDYYSKLRKLQKKQEEIKTAAKCTATLLFHGTGNALLFRLRLFRF